MSRNVCLPIGSFFLFCITFVLHKNSVLYLHTKNSTLSKTLLITPPFTQLNTPYPATAVLKGFLKAKNIPAYQFDLGLEVILYIFSRKGLTQMFQKAEAYNKITSENAVYIFALKHEYINCIEPVIEFLQGNNSTLAYKINQRSFLPEALRFRQITDLDEIFGTMGLHDKAKYMATLFIEDICDFITECVDTEFGLSRYAERLGRCANSFNELYDSLNKPDSFIDSITIDVLETELSTQQYSLIVITIPFAGNVYSAFKCGQYIKSNYPQIKIAVGGGFANTELRSITDMRVFEFVDFITLDDGELPLELIYKGLGITVDKYKRTFLLKNNEVTYIDNSDTDDYLPKELPAPDFSDLKLNKYISVIEVANPMHNLWSNGRWNKMAMAHGCYWGKCTFCDCTLDYINRFSSDTAQNLVDKVEQVISQTGETGFHFVDEAAPPALMRDFAIELIRRNLKITWWTNIRFEKSFTADLCYLLSESGCIAVSGGIEVASDRLLKLINKGVSMGQVVNVTRNFAESGIMVHAYLMYGFPTQTEQETVDSLEMVRQMFDAGLLKSAFWHQFALTAHSPVFHNYEKYNIAINRANITFADNDVDFTHNSGINHSKYGYGLKKAVYNFMHGIGFDIPVYQWFDFQTPKPKVDKLYIENKLLNYKADNITDCTLVWIGGIVKYEEQAKFRKGKTVASGLLTIYTKQSAKKVSVQLLEGKWLCEVLNKITLSGNGKTLKLSQLKSDYEQYFENFGSFWESKPLEQLREIGLLCL